MYVLYTSMCSGGSLGSPYVCTVYKYVQWRKPGITLCKYVLYTSMCSGGSLGSPHVSMYCIQVCAVEEAWDHLM